jgi:ribosomal protein S12 methylthiotransferase accessory factor
MATSFLQPAPKFRGRLHRTVSASDTCRRVAPIAERIGVTRIADITGLDRLGIPTYSCVRPAAIAFSVAGVSVTCGKGISREQARAGAMMEAIEYCCAEPGALATRHETFEALARTERALDPRELILPNWSPYRPDRKIYWVAARELATGETWWVPANAVFHPFVPEEGEALILRGNTAGLASGNTIEEAICHGLAELIEHDAHALCAVRSSHGEEDAFPGIDGCERNEDVAWLLACFERSQVALYIRDITTDVGVRTYYVTSIETSGLHQLRHAGFGTHVDPAIALVRALTEAAQSRAADIQGSREDLAYLRGNGPADDVARDEDRPWDFSEPSRRVPFPEGPSVDHTDIRDDIFWMLDRLAQCGIPRVFVTELTRPELGVPVVRVIAPGLEHVGVDAYRVGNRARRAAASASTFEGET